MLAFTSQFMRIPVTLTLAPDVCVGLDQLAAREDLSRSNTANRLLREMLAARDALPAPAIVAQVMSERASA
jgi:hypothetical protein